jgi:hypothetical protein
MQRPNLLKPSLRATEPILLSLEDQEEDQAGPKPEVEASVPLSHRCWRVPGTQGPYSPSEAGNACRHPKRGTGALLLRWEEI